MKKVSNEVVSLRRPILIFVIILPRYLKFSYSVFSVFALDTHNSQTNKQKTVITFCTIFLELSFKSRKSSLYAV